jgi:hypothetical protein
VERPLKGCGPPKEVARDPADDTGLRMHVSLESWVGRAPSCEDSLTGGTQRVEEELDAGARTVKERRKATKSGGLVQARKAATFWHG